MEILKVGWGIAKSYVSRQIGREAFVDPNKTSIWSFLMCNFRFIAALTTLTFIICVTVRPFQTITIIKELVKLLKVFN